jgi:hypothetical protein
MKQIFSVDCLKTLSSSITSVGQSRKSAESETSWRTGANSPRMKYKRRPPHTEDNRLHSNNLQPVTQKMVIIPVLALQVLATTVTKWQESWWYGALLAENLSTCS